MSSDPNGPVMPPPPGVVSNYDEPVDWQRRNMFIVFTTLCVFFSTLAVFARVYTRLRLMHIFGWDDAFAVISLGLNVGLTVSFVGQLGCGLTFYPWNIKLGDYMDNYFASWIYWNANFTLFLYLEFPAIKLSILLLYLRLLGPVRKTLRIGVWVLVGLMVAITIGTVAALLQMCHPVGALFNIDLPGTCDINDMVFIAQSALQIITDLLILFPPIPIIWAMNLPRGRKIEFLVPLCIGLVVTGIGIARMVALIQQLFRPNFAIDISYDGTIGTFLAIFEINFALIASCLPALNQLYGRVRAVARSRRSKPSPAASNELNPSEGTNSTSKKSSKNKRSSISQLLEDTSDHANGTDTWFEKRDGGAGVGSGSTEKRTDESSLEEGKSHEIEQVPA